MKEPSQLLLVLNLAPFGGHYECKLRLAAACAGPVAVQLDLRLTNTYTKFRDHLVGDTMYAKANDYCAGYCWCEACGLLRESDA